MIQVRLLAECESIFINAHALMIAIFISGFLYIIIIAIIARF